MIDWYESPSCPVNDLVNYIVSKDCMRDAQIEAIKTYLYLKIACTNQSLANLFISGTFNSIDVSELELKDSVKEVLKNNPAASALYEYATLVTDEGEQVAPQIEKTIKNNPNEINYSEFFKEAFYNVSYSDYLFSLPMGAGKTYLMAAFIYLDLYFAMIEPFNTAFAHNFIVFAPSGLKSSVVPSLKTIQNFDPSWVIPEPSATNIKKLISFEVLDQNKTTKKSNKTKNPNVQKIASHQPLQDLFGLVAVTNAEKVILDRITEERGQVSFFQDSEDDKDRQANELRNLLGKLPSLSIFIDEVHHAVSDEIKLRAVVNKWIENNNSINSVIGFSGTPYLESQERIDVTDKLRISIKEITNVVYYYPLVKGIGNFLKQPKLRITHNASSSKIVEDGVREFLNEYKDKKYNNGLTAKLGIYCGTIERLENEVYPLVVKVVKEYGMPASCILKNHDGNKKFPAPTDARMEFEILDSTLSKIRIVLLVQIGKEGWDCKSLTGIILSQERDCPTNMVLQTSCRCLRQVEKGVIEPALICLNEDNAQALEAQLQQQHHTSLSEFQKAETTKTVLTRYDRTKRLKLPNVEFYQLKIRYDTLVVEKADTAKQILSSMEGSEKASSITFERSLSNSTLVPVKIDDSENGRTFTTFYMWLNGIVKGSFGTLSMDDLKPYSSELNTIFERITYLKEGVRFFSSKYDISIVDANIRKAFVDIRDFRSVEEIVPESASLLNVKNFTDKIQTDDVTSYIPDTKLVESIINDDNGKLKIDAKTQEAVRLLRETGNDATADMILAEKTSHKNKDRLYHYLPYHTDSNFESKFYLEVSEYPLLSELNLEFYYNGDRALTEFKIRCFKNCAGKWYYIGIYTPDFLIIQRENDEIHKAIVIETKGSIYAQDAAFLDKRKFMEQYFVTKNNEAFGYERFQYLYLEDSLSDSERLRKTYMIIKEFFAK